MDEPRRVGLVGRVKAKGPVPAPAQQLYTSALFRGRRAYVERSCSQSWILSALHGLVDPREELAPYDVALKNAGVRERRAWSAEVLADLSKRARLGERDVVEIHAGAEYRDYGLTDGLRRKGIRVEIPAEGMPLGRQLQFYRDAADA